MLFFYLCLADMLFLVFSAVPPEARATLSLKFMYPGSVGDDSKKPRGTRRNALSRRETFSIVWTVLNFFRFSFRFRVLQSCLRCFGLLIGPYFLFAYLLSKISLLLRLCCCSYRPSWWCNTRNTLSSYIRSLHRRWRPTAPYILIHRHHASSGDLG